MEVDAEVVGCEHSQRVHPHLGFLYFLNEFMANEEGTKMGKKIKKRN
jgi:hypothetical protein